MTKKKRFHIIISVIFASMGIGVLGVLVYRLLRHFGLHLKPSILEDTDFEITHQGLSESEVEARRTDEAVQAQIFAKNRSRKNLWHKNLFSIFNLTSLVLAISQFLLKDPLGASLTMVALALSILFNIFRESVAAKKVGELAIQTRPMAAVIRDGQLKSIDQDEIVVDDLLIAGQGDEILADGILLDSANLMIDETSLGEQGALVTKNAGDILFAGTYVQAGWVQYRITRINIDFVVNEDPKYHPAPIRKKTPLQKIVDRVLYVLLVFVGIFYVSLIFELISIQILPTELMVNYRQTMSIIFSIFPSGLMFTIVLNYAVGSADMARSDVLVRNSLTIESLAQVSTVGFIRHGEVMGFNIELDMLSAADGSPNKLSENQVMQALGNYVHSTLAKSYPLMIIKENLEGERHAIKQESRYLSIYGWEAATFSSADMPGSFVVGYPETLAPYLIEQEVIEQETEENLPARKNRAGLAGRLRIWFGKGKGKTKNAAEIATNEAETQEVDTNPSQTEAAVQEKPGRLRIFNNFRHRLAGVFSRRKEDEEQPVEKGQEEIKRLMFAYSPDTQPVYDDDYRPQCPQNLTPLCMIKFVDEVRPEVKNAVQVFKEDGISIKILTEDDPANSLKTAEQLGLIEAGLKEIPFTTGEEISQFTTEELQAVVLEKSIFAQINSEQMIKVLDALQAQDEHVAVLGTSIADLKVMHQANLRITRKSSLPTVLDHADIIVLKNIANALPNVLKKGQRIVNGLLDVLKLNLTRIACTLMLLVAMYATGGRIFYYHPAQGGVISAFTVILPSIALSLWASANTIKGKNMQRILFHFFIPAAAMISLCILLINFLFRNAGFGITYTQQVVTHTLVLMGLILVVFVQPPVRLLEGGDDSSRNWQPSFVAALLFLVFQLATRLSIAQRFLMIAPLQSARHYLLIFGIVLLWSILLLGIWRLIWPERFRPHISKPNDEIFVEAKKSRG